SHVVVLQKGVVLYTGSVTGMINSEGFFELQADNNATLADVLRQHPAIEKMEQADDKLIVYINQPLEAGELNRYLFSNGISLNHLVKRTNSLEEQFLQLTSNQTN